MSERLTRLKPEAGRRYLLLVRAGDESLHRNWIDTSEDRKFDLLVSYFGAQEGRYREDGEFYHVQTGPAWPAYHEIMRNNPLLRESYDYIGFADDDLDADMATWNALFVCCEAHGFDLAQPSILGPVSYPITAPVPGLLYRRTNFVENMCPIFSRRGLSICHPSLGESVSGWGICHVWPKLLMQHDGRLAIIDQISVTHTRELHSGSLYRLLQDRGIDPMSERASVMARNGIEGPDIRELSRVPRVLPEKLTRLKPEAGRRYLLLVRAGDHSLHRNWIDTKQQRKFDLLVSYYGAEEGRYREDGEFYHVLAGPAWPAYHQIMRDNPQLRESYDYIGFADDDLDADMATWNALFVFCHAQGFDLAQPFDPWADFLSHHRAGTGSAVPVDEFC